MDLSGEREETKEAAAEPAVVRRRGARAAQLRALELADLDAAVYHRVLQTLARGRNRATPRASARRWSTRPIPPLEVARIAAEVAGLAAQAATDAAAACAGK
jgi:hypothetical protein